MAPMSGGLPKLGYHSGIPIIRIKVFWGLYWVPPILGNYDIPYHNVVVFFFIVPI